MVFKMFKNGALPILESAKEIIIKQTKVEGIPSSEQQKWHIQSVDGIRPVPVMQSHDFSTYIYIYVYIYIYIVNAYHKPAILFRPEGWHEVLHIAKPAKSRYDIRYHDAWLSSVCYDAQSWLTHQHLSTSKLLSTPRPELNYERHLPTPKANQGMATHKIYLCHADICNEHSCPGLAQPYHTSRSLSLPTLQQQLLFCKLHNLWMNTYKPTSKINLARDRAWRNASWSSIHWIPHFSIYDEIYSTWDNVQHFKLNMLWVYMGSQHLLSRLLGGPNISSSAIWRATVYKMCANNLHIWKIQVWLYMHLYIHWLKPALLLVHTVDGP